MPEEKVNVLAIYPIKRPGPLPEECFQQIIEVSPRVNAQNASAVADAERNGDPAAKKQLDALLAEAEVIYGFPPPLGIPVKNITTRAPKLKWIQCAVSGMDSFAVPEVMESKITLTNASGIHGVQVGELAFTHMIMLAKNARRIFRQMGEKRHESFIPIVLEAKTAGVLGLGPIGKYIARLCKGFGMRVIAVEALPSVRCRHADAIFPPEKLHEALAQCDFVIDALPLLASTAKIIGEAELRAMKPTAFFINIGRGGTVDQDVLIRALSENWIAGAGLDALTPEPLPPDSKLWDLPNVIITSHIAGQRADHAQLATDLFCKNLKRYLSGKKLFNIIDKKTLVAKPGQ